MTMTFFKVSVVVRAGTICGRSLAATAALAEASVTGAGTFRTGGAAVCVAMTGGASATSTT